MRTYSEVLILTWLLPVPSVSGTQSWSCCVFHNFLTEKSFILNQLENYVYELLPECPAEMMVLTQTAQLEPRIPGPEKPRTIRVLNGEEEVRTRALACFCLGLNPGPSICNNVI